MAKHIYVWQTSTWPKLVWKAEPLLGPLGSARRSQGRLLGQAESIGLKSQAEILIEEAFTTAAIEGEKLDRDRIRSSVARRLGLPTAGLPPTDRNVDGLVEVLIDATTNRDHPLSPKRLKGWHAALFPTGYSGMKEILVGRWRKTVAPMRVVSGPIGKERVHYEAPPAKRLDREMADFVHWWHSWSLQEIDGLVRAGVAHFWFVSIHPFEDGNGRIARAITDMALAQDEELDLRLYSMSAQIVDERDDYYKVLERNQKGDGDVTDWLVWFLGCLERSMRRAEGQVHVALQRARFWRDHSETTLNERQRKVVNRLLDVGRGKFEGGLTNRKYVALTKVSRETAKRDIADLVDKGILARNPGGGRNASYDIVLP
jgi:Fic family protein